MNNTKQLNVGDAVFQSHYREIINRFLIDRVTNKMAFIGNRKFKRDVSYGILQEIGSKGFGSSWMLETDENRDELNERLRRRDLIRELGLILDKFKLWHTPKLGAILNAIKNYDIVNTANKRPPQDND